MPKCGRIDNERFAGAIEGMGKGWDAGMELLTELLAELQV
jgi:hypothetical protein